MYMCQTFPGANTMQHVGIEITQGLQTTEDCYAQCYAQLTIIRAEHIIPPSILFRISQYFQNPIIFPHYSQNLT